MEIAGTAVRGVDLDGETRCAHYGTARDVIAIRFRCCDEFFACSRCHDALADHDPSVWPRERFDAPAVLCGACGGVLTVERYLDCEHACPDCGAAFNPGCANHYDHYFAVGDSERG
jgi:uncharacterized CHY-type Zn-finger protein